MYYNVKINYYICILNYKYMNEIKAITAYLEEKQWLKFQKIMIEKLGRENITLTINLLIRDYELKEGKK